MRKLESFFKNKRILITGHSGFKGSWLMRWYRSFYEKKIVITDSQIEYFMSKQ